MDHWFDELTKQVASGSLSRREILRQMAAAALASLAPPLLGRSVASARSSHTSELAAASARAVNGAVQIGPASLAPITYGAGKSFVTRSAVDTYNNQVTSLQATVSQDVLQGVGAGPYVDERTKKIVPVGTTRSLSSRWVVTTGSAMVLTVDAIHRRRGHARVEIEYGVGFSGAKNLKLEWNDDKGSGSLDGRALRTFTKTDTQLYFSDGQPVPARTISPATKRAINRVLAKFKASTASSAQPVRVAYDGNIIADGNNPPQPNTSDCTACQTACGFEYTGCIAGVAVGCAASCGVGCIVDFALEGTGNGCANAVQNCVNTCSQPGNACCPASCNVDGNCCQGNGAHCCIFGPGSQTCCPAGSACSAGGCCPPGQIKDNSVSSGCCDPGHGAACGWTCCAAGTFCADFRFGLCCPKNQTYCKNYDTGTFTPERGLCCAEGTTCCSNFHMPNTYGGGGAMVCCPNDGYVCVGSYGFRGPCVKKSEMCGDQFCPGACKKGKCCFGVEEHPSGPSATRWCGDTCCQGECCGHDKNMCCGLCLSGQRTTLGTCCDTGTACGTKCCEWGCADAKTSTCKKEQHCAHGSWKCTSSMPGTNATETLCCHGNNPQCYGGKCCPPSTVVCVNNSTGKTGCWPQAQCRPENIP